jgi:hypothetical protein
MAAYAEKERTSMKGNNVSRNIQCLDLYYMTVVIKYAEQTKCEATRK